MIKVIKCFIGESMTFFPLFLSTVNLDISEILKITDLYHIMSVAQPGGRQMGNCPFHLEVCPSKFLSGSFCPLKFYFFENCFFNFLMRYQFFSGLDHTCTLLVKRKWQKNHFKINFW